MVAMIYTHPVLTVVIIAVCAFCLGLGLGINYGMKIQEGRDMKTDEIVNLLKNSMTRVTKK